ncbi:MAG TPA: UDP-glucose 4-epimerase GalE [Phycisphaerae bacterium]|nr:UDP-glucose 4-epimerase GalE [Phycisphaerae bacterium]HNU46979.1 UDP-glucose 4-epimerase GalE [Phycisphaerae bacterium]
MKILATGGAGYVGSHCVRELCAGGHDVAVYDNLRDGGHREAVDPRARLVVGDLADRALLERTFAEGRFDAVMHFAARLNVGESVREPLRYYRNNVVNTVSLLEVMQAHAMRRLVFSSSCATYGIPPGVPVTEDMPQAPISPYGHTKLAMEWALRGCAEAWGLGATALRYFNAAGAAADGTLGEDRDPEYHLIPLVLQVALGQRERVEVFGTDYPTPDGSCIRDYVHVEDLADVHRRALESQPAGVLRCLNVGTGAGTSVRQIIEVAREVTGREIPAAFGPRRPGDPPALYADPSRAMRELHWQPRYPEVRRIIETAWNWHRTHPHGYASVRSPGAMAK